jgi:Fic family protein
MALSHDENTRMRLYSLSSQIVKERDDYYLILEETQEGNGDITKWLIWFFDMFSRALETSASMIEKSLVINKFFSSNESLVLNERQKKYGVKWSNPGRKSLLAVLRLRNISV